MWPRPNPGTPPRPGANARLGGDCTPMKPPSEGISSVVSWAVLGGFAALVVWLGWRSRSWPLIHDAPIMHYIAWRIGEGAAPYRDLLDMNFPGVYLLHAALLRL